MISIHLLLSFLPVFLFFISVISVVAVYFGCLFLLRFLLSARRFLLFLRLAFVCLFDYRSPVVVPDTPNCTVSTPRAGNVNGMMFSFVSTVGRARSCQSSESVVWMRVCSL